MTMDRLNQLWMGPLKCMLTDFNLDYLLSIDGAFLFPHMPSSPVGFTTNLES